MVAVSIFPKSGMKNQYVTAIFHVLIQNISALFVQGFCVKLAGTISDIIANSGRFLELNNYTSKIRNKGNKVSIFGVICIKQNEKLLSTFYLKNTFTPSASQCENVRLNNEWSGQV